MADHIRTVKTASGATAVQIVRYEKRKRIIVSHLGSAHNEEEILALKEEASRQIEETAIQRNLFEKEKPKKSSVLVLSKSQYLGDRYTFLYEVINQLFRKFRFHELNNQLLTDLVLMRIVLPASKLESLEYLAEMFGISYKRGHLYERVATFRTFKETVLEKVIQVARKNLNFNFSIVFYDVTTLYFETFKEDTDTVI
jgi:hypothetical protein